MVRIYIYIFFFNGVGGKHHASYADEREPDHDHKHAEVVKGIERALQHHPREQTCVAHVTSSVK